jgi:UDP-N-acetylglucosamine acyltransferase
MKLEPFKKMKVGHHMVHPSSIISPHAYLGKDVEIGPYCVIGDEVYIGDYTKIGPQVFIPKDTIIGSHNQIHYGAVLGADPQDLKYEGEPSQLVIGDYNIIREYAILSRGTRGGGYVTRIGDHNLFMGNTHVAHDVQMGNHNILSHYSGLAGHVIVDNHVTIGASCVIHQFCKLGDHSMIGACSFITKDVLPFSLTQGNPAKCYGINAVGLKRRSFNYHQRLWIQRVFKILQQSTNMIEDLENFPISNEDEQCLQTTLINFIQNSERGIYKN